MLSSSLLVNTKESLTLNALAWGEVLLNMARFIDQKRLLEERYFQTCQTFTLTVSDAYSIRVEQSNELSHIEIL